MKPEGVTGPRQQPINHRHQTKSFCRYLQETSPTLFCKGLVKSVNLFPGIPMQNYWFAQFAKKPFPGYRGWRFFAERNPQLSKAYFCAEDIVLFVTLHLKTLA